MSLKPLSRCEETITSIAREELGVTDFDGVFGRCLRAALWRAYVAGFDRAPEIWSSKKPQEVKHVG